MTFQEFQKEVITFAPEKDNLKDKVNDLFAKGASLQSCSHIVFYN